MSGRKCANPDCRKDISDTHGNIKYCSPHCRYVVRRKNNPRYKERAKIYSQNWKERHPDYKHPPRKVKRTPEQRRREKALYKLRHPEKVKEQRKRENIKRRKGHTPRNCKYCGDPIPDNFGKGNFAFCSDFCRDMSKPLPVIRNKRSLDEIRETYRIRAEKRRIALAALTAAGVTVSGETREQRRHAALLVARKMGVPL